MIYYVTTVDRHEPRPHNTSMTSCHVLFFSSHYVSIVSQQATSASSTSITCSLPNQVAPGSQPLNVAVRPDGLASGSINVTVKVLSITSMTPSALSLSGWSRFKLTSLGGISMASCPYLAVSVGGFACPVVNCGPGFITAIFPGVKPIPG